MLNFESDYITGAHPKVLQRLIDTNLEPQSGYARDSYTASAIEKIRAACQCPEAEVLFISGGTQTNALVVSGMLRDYEGVVAAETGHISTHEAGAIEYTGNKVLTLPQHEGKLDAGELRQYMQTFYSDQNHEHMVFPGMVYITHPTELGTLYSLQEMTAIADVCHEYRIPLYLDGARLGYGLASLGTDVTLADVARLCDVFYIGGTKVGALCGEALMFTKGNMPPHSQNLIKKRGALMAKGRLIGAQFEALFTDSLYEEIGAHAIRMAEKMKAILREAGFVFCPETPTNQQFVLVENSRVAALQARVACSFWDRYDDSTSIIRFVTCWSTTEEDLEGLRKALQEL